MLFRYKRLFNGEGDNQVMTKRQRYLTILRKQKADNISWVPNFDYWLHVNIANGTMPGEYEGLSRNDIVRAIDATIWARVNILNAYMEDVEVRVESVDQDKHIRTTYKTPVGEVSTVSTRSSDVTQAYFLTEHMVKDVSDLKVLKFIVEHTQYLPDYEAYYDCDKDVGDDGISLVALPTCVPYIQFAKTDCGWEVGIYLWMDYRKEVEEIFEAYFKKSVEAAKLLAKSPAEVVQIGDNMDQITMPPNIFKKYAIPFYKSIASILHGEGKIFQAHWCGRTDKLMPLVPETDLDVIEAVVSKPMSNLEIPKALDDVQGKTILQGGVPSVLVCPQGGTKDDLKIYLEDLLSKVPIGEKFVLGMGDNVPPDAEFSRVKMIADMVNCLKT
jgi:hypothetical protein